jgi:hypothetical protein
LTRRESFGSKITVEATATWYNPSIAEPMSFIYYILRQIRQRQLSRANATTAFVECATVVCPLTATNTSRQSQKCYLIVVRRQPPRGEIDGAHKGFRAQRPRRQFVHHNRPRKWDHKTAFDTNTAGRSNETTPQGTRRNTLNTRQQHGSFFRRFHTSER